MMVTEVQRWGNSQGVRIVKRLLNGTGIAVGDEVDVIVRDGTIMVAPVGRMRGKHGLHKLVARIPKDYRPQEVDWGAPVGKEVL